MKKIEQLEHAKNLLSQALSTAMASLPNNPSVNEAGRHIKQAINKIEIASQTQLQKKKGGVNSQFESWWGNIQAGVASQAMAPMSPQARQRKLADIDSLINQEKAKLQELEKLSDQGDTESGLLEG